MIWKREYWITLGFVLFRASLVWRFFYPFTWSGAAFGISELSALLLTLRGFRLAKSDRRSIGLIVPLLYILPLLFRQTTTPTGFAGLLTVTCFLQIIMRLQMRNCLTVGVPMYIATLQTVCYSKIRHPLAATEFGQAVCFLLTFPTLWNLSIACFVLPAIIASALIEERFLLTIDGYRQYAERVRSRFIPGVI